MTASELAYERRESIIRSASKPWLRGSRPYVTSMLVSPKWGAAGLWHPQAHEDPKPQEQPR